MTPSPSTLTAPPTDAGTRPSRLRDWQGFAFETGYFVLHVPSSHVMEVGEPHYRIAAGLAFDPEAMAELEEMAKTLPLPPPRPIEPNILAVTLNMAQGCNLRCTYCFAGDGDYGQKGMMSFETAVAVLTQLAAGKERFRVSFFGGEPMLNYEVIKRVVEWCETQPTKFSFGITTNGTLLTKEKLEWMKSKRFTMTLSYDGKGLQKRQRLTKGGNADSEMIVEKKLAAFSEQLHSMREVVLRATVTKENIDKLEEAILSTLNSQTYTLTVSHHATPLRAFQFTEDDIAALATVYRNVIERLLANQDYERLLQLDNVRKHLDRIKNGRTGQIACGAGVHYLTVSATGAYYLCHRFNEDESERYGDVEHGLDQEKLSRIAAFRLKRAEPCGSCWMREWCAGGCFHEHKAFSGDKFSIDPMYCKLQGLEIEQAMRVYTILREKAPHLL